MESDTAVNRLCFVGVGSAMMVGLATCGESARVSVQNGDEPFQVVVQVTSERLRQETPRNLYLLVIKPCSADQHARWLIQKADTSARLPTRIPYGRTPAGWHQVGQLRPLVPGCYEANVSGYGARGGTVFHLDGSGRLVKR
jgi:hypothetical protein